MSLESQVAALVSAASNLTSQVAGKMKEIDQKVDEATKSVPKTIRGLSQQTFYIDALTGDDANDGTTSAPLKTIMGAQGKAVNGGHINLWFKENQTHVVEGFGFAMEAGLITLGKWGDRLNSASHPVLVFRPTYLSSSNTYFGFFVRLSSGTIITGHCKIQTDFDASLGTLDHGAGFFGYTNGDVSILLHLSDMSLRNAPILAVYSGYVSRDISISNSSIEVIENTTGMAKLLYNRSSGTFHAFKLNVYTVTLVNGLTWADLIDYYADKRNILTNVALP